MPNNNSGALYQRVTISLVIFFIGKLNDLANPKSAIFKFPLLSTKILWGFKSLCIIPKEWQ